jgi:hypothetical protein
MANNRKVVQIFLASPGDLQQERQAAKAVVDAFNKRWADWFGIQIELVGWEDTFKRFGRPQEQINLDLDRREAFIGMIWRKWGTHPGGQYTSGFEEEYERAVASRKKSARPEMTLLFKKIDAEFLKDQGPDLKKVLSFRERIIIEKLILFEEFETPREFEDKLDSWITRYVQQLKKQEAVSVSEEPQAQPSDEASAKAEPAPPSYTPLTTEGAEFLREFVAKTERQTPVEVARFRLLAATVGVQGNDENSLAPHDANLLFQNRATLTLSRREMEGLIASGLDNIVNEVVPLWHWYVMANAQETGYFSWIALAGSQSQRFGALTAMRLIGEPIRPLPPIADEDSGIDRRAFIRSWLSPTNPERLRVAALEYLAACGDEVDLPILTEEYEKRGYQTVSAAADAIIRINLRQSREKAVKSLIALQPENIEQRLTQAIFAKPASLGTALLLDGVAHRNAKVRATIVTILTARNALPLDAAERLLDDSESIIRFEALRCLIRDGREFTDDKARSIIVKPPARTGIGLLGYPPLPPDKEGEALWVRFMKSKLRALSEAALEKLQLATTIFEQDARFALDFKLFRSRGPALRASIDDHFQSEFDAAYRDLEKRLIDADTLTRLKSLQESIRKELVRKGTDLLSEKGEPEDLQRIRRVVSSGFAEFSSLDVEYLKKHGEWQDVAMLIGLLDRRDESATLLSGLFDNDDNKMRPIAEAIHAIGQGRFPELCKVPMPVRFSRALSVSQATRKSLSFRTMTSSRCLARNRMRYEKQLS